MDVRRTVRDGLVGQGISRDLVALAGTQTVAAFGAGMVIGIRFSVFGIVRSILQVPMGRLSDRVGVRRPFLEAGMLGSAATLYAYGTVGTVSALISVRVLHGVALAADVVDEHRSGEQMGVVTTAFSVGFAFGSITAGAVAFLGFAVPFLFAGALTVIGASIVWLLVEEPAQAA